MIRDHSGHGHSQWQIVLMFPIGCDHTKNYFWMNNSIFLRPGSNDRLPILIPCLSVFSHPTVFSPENVQSSMYIFYVYFSDMASHFLGNNMSTTMWLIHPKSYLCATVNTFAVISSYVPEFAARLHKPNDASGAFTKTSLLTRAWRHRSRPSWLSNMAAPICELAYYHEFFSVLLFGLYHSSWRLHLINFHFSFIVHFTAT